ncbi:MAG: PilZ domain-containing protein [Candidatus Omnitrophica bacterium]|nr:PilZ domain-containing protein [Candidatus Omnitrophota bacterium]
MDKVILEKRQYPRISANLPIKITPEFLGEVIDLSEAGLKFVLDKPLLLSKAQAKIELAADEHIKTEFKIIWSKHLVQENKFTYGVCFIRLKEKDIEILRSLALNNQIRPILEKVSNQDEKGMITKFWLEEFKPYLNNLMNLSTQLEDGNISLDKGSRELVIINNRIMEKCDELEVALNNKILTKKIKKIFRDFCWGSASKSFIVKRAFEKPLGYPGDYKLIEVIYANTPVSEKIGYCIDQYFLSNEFAVAIRNRRQKMLDLLIKNISEANLDNISILNLGCGSSREINEMLSDKTMLSKSLSFSLVDQDKEALEFSKNMLTNSPKNIKFNFLQHNILEYSKKPKEYVSILKKQDIIYSIGLADYLPDRVLRDLISFCFSLLKPKGRLIIAHKDISRYKPLPPDWWCDWTFYSRDENYLLEIVDKSQLGKFKIEVTREPSGIIFFLTINKI